MSNSAFLRPFANGLNKAVQPLLLAFYNEEELETMLYQLGWNVSIDNSGLAEFNAVFTARDILLDIYSFIETLEEGSFDDEKELVEQTLELLKDIVTLIKNLESASSTSGIPPFDNAEFWKEASENLFNYLLYVYLRDNQPFFFALFHTFGILDELPQEPEGAYRINFTKYVVNWEKLPDLFTNPGELFTERYGWNTGSFDHVRLFDTIERILIAFDVRVNRVLPQDTHTGYIDTSRIGTDQLRELQAWPVFGFYTGDSSFWKLGFNLLPVPATPGANAAPEGLLLTPVLQGGTSTSISLTRDLYLRFQGAFDADNVIKATVLPSGASLDTDITETEISAEVALIGAPESPWILIGSENATRIELEGCKVALGMTGEISDPEIYFSLSTGEEKADGSLPVVRAFIQLQDGADGFLQKIFAILGTDPLTLEFGAALKWSSKTGITFEGQAAFELAKTVHIALGPLEINTIYIQLKAGSYNSEVYADKTSFDISLGVAATLEIGPFKGMVDNIGVIARFVPLTNEDEPGTFGNLHVDFAFKPPTGLGLSIDAQGFSGGGFLFLDADKGEYAGGLELSFQDSISLKIIGILNTIMPDGTNGFSLILIITAEFTPIQLGFGFTLNGVGGLIGINRTVEIDVLQSGVKDGSLNSILFPEDIVANAVQIVTDIKKVFPVYEGQYAFGPMAEIGYGSPTLITLQLGLIIELPDPVRIAILGVLRCLLPDEDFKLLSLQVNFLGVIDFEKKYISFDASLYDSKLLTFTLTGDMALRLSWGSEPVFVLSVGGFHPSYEPPANLGLGDMERLSINLFSGNNPRLRIENYFAVTSNTAQFGANGQLYVSKAGFDVEGYIGFDVLFQFSPFYFIAQISASLSVSYEGEDILSIHLSLSLDGPTPWHAKGNASFKFLLFKVSVSISETFGDTRNTTLAPVDVWPLLEAALKEKANWQAEMPSGSNLLVTLKTIEADDDTIIAHPCGILNISQKLVPLNMNIDKYGNQSVSGDSTFSISKVVIGTEQTGTGTLKEEFAPGQYFEYSDAEKLSSKDFEKYDSGLSVNGSGNLKTGYVAELEVEYELKYLHKKTLFTLIRLNLGLFLAFLKGNATSKSKLAAGVKLPSVIGTQKVQINPEKFVIANTGDLQLVDEAYVFSSEREARLQMEELISNGNIVSKNIQVIPSYELNV
jgi:hypothetical protein